MEKHSIFGEKLKTRKKLETFVGENVEIVTKIEPKIRPHSMRPQDTKSEPNAAGKCEDSFPRSMKLPGEQKEASEPPGNLTSQENNISR